MFHAATPSADKKQDKNSKEYVGRDRYSHYVILLQMNIRRIDPGKLASLSKADKLFIQRVKALSSDYVGACYAYSLLNSYIIQHSQAYAALSRKANKENATEENIRFFKSYVLSQIDVKIRMSLEHLHAAMCKDELLNWFGTPKPKELTRVKIYQGQLEYNQNMQYMIAHLAKHLANARLKLHDRLQDQLDKMRPIDLNFLDSYVSATASPLEVAQLDELGCILIEESADFLTIQMAMQLYRFCIVAETNFAGCLNFIMPRTKGMPIGLVRKLDPESIIHRVEALLPEGKIKDGYYAGGLVAPRKIFVDAIYSLVALAEDYLNTYSEDVYKKDVAKIYTEAYATPLTGHYCPHMDNILARIGVTEIHIRKTGSLPLYEEGKEGRLKEVNFSTVDYNKDFHDPKGTKLRQIKNKIQNNRINQMLEGVDENWAGESFYKHFNRLFVVAVLTKEEAVAEAAARHLEWFYDNVMPFERASAAVAEAINKATILSQEIVPAQMRGVLPDLGAICHLNEQEFVDRYHEYYSESKYKVSLTENITPVHSTDKDIKNDEEKENEKIDPPRSLIP